MRDTKAKAEQEKPSNLLNWIGCLVTAVWLGLILTYALLNYRHVAILNPNEWGDALAGAFAPLAFFWLVLGFFQQGKELRHSAAALHLQGVELANSVEQQRELVNVTREQLVFESHRLTQERAEASRRSQPDFDLASGGSSQSGSQITQTFILTNHGRTCTRLVASFGGREAAREIARFETGAERYFSFDMRDDVPEKFVVHLTYLDESLSPGATSFSVEGVFPRFVIERESAAQGHAPLGG